MMDKRVERIPVCIGNVAADRPQIAEDERGADDGIELRCLGFEVNILGHEEQALE